MANQNEKPVPFKRGATTLSAAALNSIIAALPRLIRGGAGICVEKMDDRLTVRLADDQGGKYQDRAVVKITEIKDTYLVCDKDGASINVAKPWALRKDVVWPGGGRTYTYTTASQRVSHKTGLADENQQITPDYEVDEELLVLRLPSARINDIAGKPIVWVDANNAGRSWAQVAS